MCYDISFTADMETLAKYEPSLKIDPNIDFGNREHVMAQAYSKYPVILQEDHQYQVKMFEWDVR